MRINRDLLGWGLFLIVLGAVPLAVRGGYVDEDVVRRAWELWPLVIIGIGLGLMLRRTQLAVLGGLVVAVTFGLMAGSLLAVGIGGGFSACGMGSQTGDPFTGQTGTLTAGARVQVELDCGELVVAPGAGSAWTLGGTSHDGRVPDVEASADRLRIDTPERRGFGFSAGEDWQLALPTDPSLRLEVDINAGSARIGLAGAHVPEVDVTVNAGDVRLDLSGAAEVGRLEADANAGSIGLTLPAASMSGSLSANAGSVEVCVPSGAGLRFQTTGSPLSANNFADQGLERDGNTWTTPGFDAATVRLDFSADANAGSINLNPEGGCD